MSLIAAVPRRLAVAALVVVLLGVGARVWWPGGHAAALEVSADFADTTGIYVGNEVQYLGVPVGHIVAIEPRGRVMTVHMQVDAGTQIPRQAVAEILQSALLTDRFVQLGPAYTGGPELADGAHIGVAHTRSPISIDDVGKAIDQLVVALDATGPRGHDIGDLLHATALNLDGNGPRIRALLIQGRAALAAFNSTAPDLRAIVGNLDVLARALGGRDAMIRRFTTNLSRASAVVAGQTGSLDQTLRSLSDLTTEVAAFIRRNRDLLVGDLADTAAVAATVHREQQTLATIFDLMPTGSENIARAFDAQAGGLRVQLAARDMMAFNDTVRAQLCRSVAGPLCQYLFNAEGTGVFDLLIDGVEGQLPEAFPWEQ